MEFSKILRLCVPAIAAGSLCYNMLGAPVFQSPGDFFEVYKNHPYSITKRILRPALRGLPRFGKYSFFPFRPELTELYQSLHYLFAPREFVPEMTERYAVGRYEGDIDKLAESYGYTVKNRLAGSWYILERKP